MPSPFPGMDLYLESQGFWQDFHFRLIALMSEALSSSLPENYAALIEERISLVDLSGDALFNFQPDVAIARQDREGTPQTNRSHVATLEPVTIPLAARDLDEVTERWIEIKRLPDLSLVTVIEILSPTNKSGLGRTDYLHMRRQLLEQPVNLVEIDLLLRGSRIPLGAPLPPGDYYALVSRADKRNNCDVYAWSVRRLLPTIPIPLSYPDPDLSVDLSRAVERAYDQGRYARLVNYAAPVDLLALTPNDREWADHQLRTGGREARDQT